MTGEQLYNRLRVSFPHWTFWHLLPISDRAQMEALAFDIARQALAHSDEILAIGLEQLAGKTLEKYRQALERNQISLSNSQKRLAEYTELFFKEKQRADSLEGRLERMEERVKTYQYRLGYGEPAPSVPIVIGETGSVRTVRCTLRPEDTLAQTGEDLEPVELSPEDRQTEEDLNSKVQAEPSEQFAPDTRAYGIIMERASIRRRVEHIQNKGLERNW